MTFAAVSHQGEIKVTSSTFQRMALLLLHFYLYDSIIPFSFTICYDCYVRNQMMSFTLNVIVLFFFSCSSFSICLREALCEALFFKAPYDQSYYHQAIIISGV